MEQFDAVKKSLQQRGFTVSCFATKEEAAAYLNGAIDGVSVGFGGSGTLEAMGLYDSLSSHNTVYWHWKQGEDARADAATAEVYLSSANAVAETGEIVNIDGLGNRAASTLYGHKKLYIVAGRNKLAPDFHQALWRARNVAGPKRAQQMKKRTPCAIRGDRCYDCKSPDRICRGLVVLWGPTLGMPTEVVLIDEDLGN